MLPNPMFQGSYVPGVWCFKSTMSPAPILQVPYVPKAIFSQGLYFKLLDPDCWIRDKVFVVEICLLVVYSF